jgi:hypothetical protein
MQRPPIILLLLTLVLLFAPIERARAGDPAALAESIDHHIQARLDTEKLKPAPAADDAEFLRRVYLDLHGVVPSAESAARFLDSADADKRRELIDELLASPRCGEHFAEIWRRRLMSPLEDEQGLKGEPFASWLAGRFNDNVGWNQVVYELLTASGTVEKNPAVNYLIEGRNPRGVTDLTDLTSRYFLGLRINCAQCHDHPFARWTRQEYWGMAAFFEQIQTPGQPKRVHRVGVEDNPKITLASLAAADMLDGFLPRPPTFLAAEEPWTSTSTTHRAALAHWITSPKNPYFARAAVNRMWWHFFGRGIVNPVDDMHAANVPSHPELLELLSEQFVESGFDIKILCRAILNSSTYQRTSRPGEHPDREAELFARMSIKVLSAEQLYDSLVTILGPPASGKGNKSPNGPRHEFVQFIADDADRDPTRYERGIPQLLRLMNSPQFAGKSLSSLVSRVATSGGSADEVADQLFLAILARRLSAEERELLRDQLNATNGSKATACGELAWALLMTSEFSLNH